MCRSSWGGLVNVRVRARKMRTPRAPLLACSLRDRGSAPRALLYRGRGWGALQAAAAPSSATRPFAACCLPPRSVDPRPIYVYLHTTTLSTFHSHSRHLSSNGLSLIYINLQYNTLLTPQKRINANRYQRQSLESNIFQKSYLGGNNSSVATRKRIQKYTTNDVVN